MASSGFFNDSPAMVLPPQQHLPDQYFHSGHYRQIDTNVAINSGLPTPRSQSSLPPTPSEGAIAGRKRSRGDIFSPEDEHVETIPLPQVPENAPSYGPGMTLVHPNDASGHYNPQSSTVAGAQRPVIATRKSQRLDCASSRPSDLGPIPQVPRTPGSEPLIDEATRMLGVSWSRMDATENTSVAQRAYTRWIARHYPNLSNIELWFENSAIPGYLGKVNNKSNGLEEFYLWSYDLHQAILVTRNPSDLVFKLSTAQMSLSLATEKIHADIEPVVEAAAANAAILHNDRFIFDDEQVPGSMEVD